MKLNLQRPLIVFDLETTGLDLVNDRIIQISYIKVHPDGKEERENLFINPQKPIPQEVEALTHITNDMVKMLQPLQKLPQSYTKSSQVATLQASTRTISTFQCLPKSSQEQALATILVVQSSSMHKLFPQDGTP